MTLQRIESVKVTNWRSWQDPAPIEGLAPGLVVLSGPNAVGKTGVWEAIVSGLLDRHWGAHTQSLRPAGTKGVIPHVVVEFQADGRRYRIEKHFGGPDQRDKASFHRQEDGAWHLQDEGEDAYVLCREAVLGSGSGGLSRGGLDKATQDTLMEVLLPPQGGLVGEAPAPEAVSMAVTNRDAASAATRLGRVLDLVTKEADAIWVGQRDRPKKGTELNAGEERLRRIDEAIEPLEDKSERIRDLVTRLAGVTEELEGLGDAAARHAEAQRLRADAADHRARREEAKHASEEAHKAYEAVEAVRARRTELDEAAAEAAEADRDALAARERAVSRREAAERELSSATKTRDALAIDVARHRDWLAYESRGADLERIGRLLAAVRERVGRVRANEDTIRETEAEKATFTLPSVEDEEELEGLDRARIQSEGRLEAGAWTVAGRLPTDLSLAVDGRAVEEDGLPARATRDVEVSGAGGETLKISAPAEDAQSAERAREALRDALARFDVASLQALRERRAYVETRLDGRIATARQGVKDALGDETLDDLLKQQFRLEPELERKEGLAAPSTTRPASDPTTWEAMLSELGDRLAEAQQRVDAAGPALGAARSDEEERRQDKADAERAAGEARAAQTAHREEHGADDVLLRAVVEAERARDAAEAVFAPLAEAQAMAEDAKEKRAGVLDAGLNEVVTKQGEVREYETRIDELRAEDPEGRLADLASEKADLEASVARARVRAEALRLVERSLHAAKEELKARVGEPIAERIRKWARYLLQDTSVVGVGEDGVPSLVTTPAGKDVPFADQSFGTREQLSVLYRLAVADLVADDTGSGVCLMLDDPFGHTDRGRRTRLLEILEAEAERRGHQVLVFTCRPEDFEGVGRHVPIGV